MSHRTVETLIGRLATDPGLRRRFSEDPEALLEEFRSRGYELTAIELAALASTAPEAIDTFAAALDERIRKASLTEPDPHKQSRRRLVPYNPFARGPAPVGVRTFSIQDESRRREFAVEIWYPATERHRGCDLHDATADRFAVASGLPAIAQHAVRNAAPAAGRFPLLLHSHAAASHRRDGAYTATHLASHGYIVVAPDHPGDTQADLIHDASTAQTGAPHHRLSDEDICFHRPLDAVLTLDRVLAGAVPDVTTRIDVELIGMFGVSLGGWTTLTTNATDQRIKAALVAAPSYGTHGPFPQTAMQTSLLRLDWGRPVPTFLIAGERDSLVMLSDLRELYEVLQPPKRFAVLSGASHFHWGENAEALYEQTRPMWEGGLIANAGVDIAALASIPFSELCPNWHATDAMKALCLAHMDEQLKNKAEAASFLDANLELTFRARGIELRDIASESRVPLRQ